MFVHFEKNPSWILLSVSISIGKKYAKMTLKSEKMPHAPLSHRTLMSYNQNVSNLIQMDFLNRGQGKITLFENPCRKLDAFLENVSFSEWKEWAKLKILINRYYAKKSPKSTS